MFRGTSGSVLHMFSNSLNSHKKKKPHISFKKFSKRMCERSRNRIRKWGRSSKMIRNCGRSLKRIRNCGRSLKRIINYRRSLKRIRKC